jgi:hypothetical protein
VWLIELPTLGPLPSTVLRRRADANGPRARSPLRVPERHIRDERVKDVAATLRKRDALGLASAIHIE